MDSGSGSLQSSSGGDEEYDSRAVADSVSAFMTSSGGGGNGGGPPMSNPPQPAPPFFDPFSNYLQLHQNPNSSLLNQTLSWPRTMRSEPNNPGSHDIINNNNSFMPSFQSPSTAVGADSNHPSTLAPPPQIQNHTAARNPKKRSRASRRAPTTVLTTDTTNFRAMVQEFTGIPAPPFTNSPFQRSRLDLFGTRSATASQPPPPQYLRRPFPQKPQLTPLPFLASSFNPGAAMETTCSNTNNNNNNNISSSSSSPAINNQTSNLFTISNPLLTSFLQTNPKFPSISNPPMMMGSSKTHNTFEIPSNAHQSQTTKLMGFHEQFGLSHGNHVPDDQTLTALPNLVPSDQNNSNPAGDKDINLMRSINGGGYNNYQRNTTNFHGEKGSENGVMRGEGMVESWISSELK